MMVALLSRVFRAPPVTDSADKHPYTSALGCTAAHRSQFELVGSSGSIRVDDQVGGGARGGGMQPYFVPHFVGSGRYFMDKEGEGNDTVVEVEKCDHVVELVNTFATAALSGTPDDQWPTRTLMCHRVMAALFESACDGGKVVEL
jgi:D-xylose 1-dehydrogenase (NADP+, D-xylono-1,5-lactone-forming)